MYYLQSRYFDPSTVRFINADSYASTGQSVIGYNMFAYCGNSPVMFVDSSGTRCVYVKDFDGGSSSKKDVAVIYDGRTSGYFWGQYGGKGFAHQGSELIKRLSLNFNVDSFTYSTLEEFITCWNSLNKEYLDVYILAHGTAGKLHCAGQSMGTRDEAYSFSDLENVDVSVINLYCCNGATINDDGNSIASILANLTGAPVIAVANGKVNFSWYGCYPEAVKGGDWTTVKPDLQ